MEWVMWLFIALIALPVIFMMIAPSSDAKRTSSNQSSAAKGNAEQNQAKVRAIEAREAEKAHRRAAREAEQNRRRAEQEEAQQRKLAAARELAELKERALRAERELKALQSSRPAPAEPDKPAADPAPVKSEPANAPQSFPQKFSGEVVAFTGTLPTMTRAEAIKATKDRGGRAFENVNTHCTLLVIGQRPGKQQQERAAGWNIKTITWEEWFMRAEISYRRRMIAQSMRKAAGAA